jgi:hypothetical protein
MVCRAMMGGRAPLARRDPGLAAVTADDNYRGRGGAEWSLTDGLSRRINRADEGRDPAGTFMLEAVTADATAAQRTVM